MHSTSRSGPDTDERGEPSTASRSARPEESRGRTRRRLIVEATASVGALCGLTGCLGYRVVPTDKLDSEEEAVTAAHQERILDQYRDGQDLRSVGSARWHQGGDEWETRGYVAAASYFDTAASYYDGAAHQFQRAREVSQERGYASAGEICETSANYCSELAEASGQYATAARAYSASNDSNGEEYREAGWNRYVRALDYEVAPVTSVESAFDE